MKLCIVCESNPLTGRQTKYCSKKCRIKAYNDSKAEERKVKDVDQVSAELRQWQKQQVKAFLAGKELDKNTKQNAWYDLETYALLFWDKPLPEDHEMNGPLDWKEWFAGGHEIEQVA